MLRIIFSALIFSLNFSLVIPFMSPTSLYGVSCCPAPAGPPGGSGSTGPTGPIGSTGPDGFPGFGPQGPPAPTGDSVTVNCGGDGSFMLFGRIPIPTVGSTLGTITTNLFTYNYVATPTSLTITGTLAGGYTYVATAEAPAGSAIEVAIQDVSLGEVRFNFSGTPLFVSFFGLQCLTF